MRGTNILQKTELELSIYVAIVNGYRKNCVASLSEPRIDLDWHPARAPDARGLSNIPRYCPPPPPPTPNLLLIKIFLNISDDLRITNLIKYQGQYHLFVNTLRPRWNVQHFEDDIFKRIFLKENVLVPIKISLRFVAGAQLTIFHDWLR